MEDKGNIKWLILLDISAAFGATVHYILTAWRWAHCAPVVLLQCFYWNGHFQKVLGDYSFVPATVCQTWPEGGEGDIDLAQWPDSVLYP